MNWLRAYISVPFKALALLIRIFKFNRGWLEARLARNPVASSIKGIFIVTLLAWFLVWLFAGDEFRGNIGEALQSFRSEIAK